MSSAYASRETYRAGSQAAGSEPQAPTRSKVTTRWSGSKAGATRRHMCWSHPKPCTNSIGWPSEGPETWTFS